MAQVILNKKTSTQASPTIYYTVEVEPSARTVDSVTLKFTVTSDLQHASSNKGVGYTMTGGVYVGGAWKSITLKASNVTWKGENDPYTATGTFTISGLTATQTEITGVKFRVVSSNTSYNGGTLTATECANIVIDRYSGIAQVNDNGEWKDAIPWINVNGEWRTCISWCNDKRTWRSSNKIIEFNSDLVSFTDDGQGNLAITLADTASVEHDGNGNMNIRATCFIQDAVGYVDIV